MRCKICGKQTSTLYCSVECARIEPKIEIYKPKLKKDQSSINVCKMPFSGMEDIKDDQESMGR